MPTSTGCGPSVRDPITERRCQARWTHSMAVAVAQTAPDRHPWLAALIAAPEAELRALVGGYADVAPYGRAEPADAAASLLFGLAEDDPARQAFDQGCRALLETMRAALLSAGDPLYERHLATLDRLLAV